MTFFIDVSLAKRDLAFASFGILKHQLYFNICSLASSYLPNAAIPDLEERVKLSISTELSYCCRFWGTHVNATFVEPLLVEEVKAFFDDERLLFWLEVVSLLKAVGGAVATLSCIADWLAVSCGASYLESVDSDDYCHLIGSFRVCRHCWYCEGCTTLRSNFRTGHFTQHSTFILVRLAFCSN